MKIGIYGGAFDPIHIEHLKIIEFAKISSGLNQVILVPSYSPPHKSQPSTSFQDRVNMMRLATMGLDYIKICDIESHSSYQYNFAYLIVNDIKKLYPNDELFYIIGGDSMVQLQTWGHPEILASLLPIIVVGRKGYPDLKESIEKAQINYNANINQLSYIGEDISSSIIRAELQIYRESNSISHSIIDYIIDKDLYNEYSDVIIKLKESLPPQLFNHSVSTLMFALKLNRQASIAYHKVFLAAILHDVAKQNQIDAVKHQFLGATVASEEYNITDSEILDAISYHTTAKENMSTLGKIVYIADKLEETRDYKKVEDLRKVALQSIDLGFLAVLKNNKDYLDSRGIDPHPLTVTAQNYYFTKE